MNSSFRKAIAINEVESVDAMLKKLRPTVRMNEGAHRSLNKTIKSMFQMPVYEETEHIIINLTDSKDVHVCELNRSFFELYLDFMIDLFQNQFPILPTSTHHEDLVEDCEEWVIWTKVPALVDIAKVIYFFIGFKNSTDCIKYFRITHNGRDVGPSIKDKVQIESYLFNVMKQKSNKENKANSFTLWEEAHAHNPSVCGQYLSMWDLYQAQLTGTNSLRVTFSVIIGFDDFLPFQNFDDFLSCVLRDFKLILRVNPDALVWCSVDPSQSIRQMAEIYPFTQDVNKTIFDYKKFVSVIGSKNQQDNYDHMFI
jgi:hypothetical protein